VQKQFSKAKPKPVEREKKALATVTYSGVTVQASKGAIAEENLISSVLDRYHAKKEPQTVVSSAFMFIS
jgi:hypothetical protein